MRLANPESVEFKINLAVSDSIILEEDAHVRVFLDSAPLDPVNAALIRSSYSVEKSDSDNLVFPLIAGLNTSQNESGHIDGKPIRIGLRGTAQVYGSYVPLVFNLFRKPLSAMRQFLGV